MSSSVHTLVKTQDSLQPIFQKASLTNTHAHASAEDRNNSNSQLLENPEGMQDNSTESIINFPDLLQNDMRFSGFSLQMSPSFNHEAGPGNRPSSMTVLKTSPGVYSFPIPDLSRTELKAGERSAAYSEMEMDDAAALSEQNPNPNSSANANQNQAPRRESIINSASSHEVPTFKCGQRAGSNSSSVRQRLLRSASAQCARVKRPNSPNRKGRGSYVCTKPKSGRNLKRR